MKIAISALGQSAYAPTGLSSYFSQLAQILPEVDPDNEYHFVVTREMAATIASTRSIADILRPNFSSRIGRLAIEHFLLGPWLERNGFDVLYMANAGVRPLLLPSSVRLVQAIFGFHQFGTGEIGRIKGLYRRLMFSDTLQRADTIILNSEYSRKLLERHGTVSRERVRVIPHGVNDKLFNDEALTTEETENIRSLCLPRRFIAFVSQMYPYKNVDVAVEAFCRFVARTGSEHRLVMVGQFSRSFGRGETLQRRLVEIAAAHGVADRLLFFEGLPVKKLRAVYRLADIYVQTSTSETYGRTTLEAMACGCPVVAARAAATPEVLGDAGLYYEGRDAEGGANAMLQLYNNEALRRECIASGLLRARKCHTRDEARQLAVVFAEAAVRGKPSADNI